MQTSPPYRRRAPIVGVLSLAALSAAALSLASCAKKGEESSQPTPVNVTLTAAQLQHIQLYSVAPASFHREVEAAGVVDFDNDQATSVLAPFGGPVTKITVEPGQKVRAGDTLALVDSPDYSAAISAGHRQDQPRVG